MAVRLITLHPKPLRVDFRDGNSLVLASGQRSAALRKELLYDNRHLPQSTPPGGGRPVPASRT